MKINIMDRDDQGIRTLVIKREGKVVEEIEQPGKGIVERSFDTCGDYTAHCVILSRMAVNCFSAARLLK